MSGRLLSATSALAALVAAFATANGRVLADTQPGDPGFGNLQSGTSGTSVDGADVTVNAGLKRIASGSGNGGAAVVAQAGDACAWNALPNQTALDQGYRNGVAPASVGNITLSDPTTQGPPGGTDPTTGTWYAVSCPVTQSIVSVWVPNNPGGGSAPQPANPLVVAQEAVARMHLSAPTIHMSPPTNAEIVNFQDWLWVDPSTWHAVSATASVGGVSATATAMPYRVIWSMGDGHQVVCNGPGTAYDQSIPPDRQQTDCSYTYPNSSAGQPGHQYGVTVTVHWRATWTAIGAPGGGNLGDIAGDVATVPVEVDEVQAVNVPSH